MSTESDVKRQVREFYDQIGWKQVGEGVYQNAHYDDLRPVVQEYVHNCHLRIPPHLQPQGRFLLDAGKFFFALADIGTECHHFTALIVFL